MSLAVFTLLRECHLAITDPLILHLCFLNTDVFFCKNSKTEIEYFLPSIYLECCPIYCLTPGTDPTYFIRNFIRHLQPKHTFHYEDYIASLRILKLLGLIFLCISCLLQTRCHEKNWADNCTTKWKSVADANRDSIVRYSQVPRYGFCPLFCCCLMTRQDKGSWLSHLLNKYTYYLCL